MPLANSAQVLRASCVHVSHALRGRGAAPTAPRCFAPVSAGRSGRANHRHFEGAGPLDGHERRGHSSRLKACTMGTMGDLGGRYAAYTTRLVDGVLASPGHTPAELRRAVLARAFGTPGEDIPPALAAYVDKVARHAYEVTDEDVGALQ